MVAPVSPKMMLPPQLRGSALPPSPDPKPGDHPTPPDPRKLRERIMMALIMTCKAANGTERAPQLIEEAEKIVSYIMDGSAPEGPA